MKNGHLLSLTLAAKSEINVSNSNALAANHMISSLTVDVAENDDNGDDITFGG